MESRIGKLALGKPQGHGTKEYGGEMRDLNKFTKQPYDLLVIGGGINGAAIANIAAGRGLKTALIEKGDFASGTSSKSSKLLHGGIRYLENFEFDLVSESLKERYLHLQTVPHLVKPLPFLIPVYKGDKRPLWMMRLGVFLYDFLAGKYRVKKRRSLTAAEVLRLEPNLKKEGLTGGVMYYDAQMDDARLCLENVLSAAAKGADAANYLEMTAFLKENGRVTGVRAKDALLGGIFEIRAKKIVCAAGPWTNRLLKLDDRNAEEKVRTTKGIHIVYSKPISENAILLQSGRDRRIFFVFPWMGCSMIGTTDTDYSGDLDCVEADAEDVRYLAEETRRVFPSFEFRQEDIVSTFAGLRPLTRSDTVPSRASRKHYIFETASGVTFVIGGKYTTYRTVAEDCVNRFTAPRKGKEYPLYGSGAIRETPEAVAGEFGVEPGIAQALMERYGARYREVLDLTVKYPKLGERVCPRLPVIKAQIVYSVKEEMAVTADDIISRRLSVGFSPLKTEAVEAAFKKAIEEVCPELHPAKK